MANRAKASLISNSSCAEILCSLASLDWRALGNVTSVVGARRLAGCEEGEGGQHGAGSEAGLEMQDEGRTDGWISE